MRTIIVLWNWAWKRCIINDKFDHRGILCSLVFM